MRLKEKITSILKEKREPLTQKELSILLPNINRAVLLGYLRALADLRIIKSKDSGKSKIYFT